MKRVRVYTEEQKARRTELARLRYLKNREKVLAQSAEYYQKNREKRLAQSIAHNRAHIEKKREISKRWAALNSDRIRAADAKYKAGNKETLKAKKAAWVGRNKERVKQVSAEYRSKNRHRFREWRKAWAARNPDANRLACQNRRARLANGRLSKGIVKKLFALQKSKCAACRIILKRSYYHLDHIAPLFLGGANADSNMQLLCPPCNMSKNKKHPIDFMQERGYLL